MELNAAEVATALPKPSPELVLLRVFLEAHLETIPRKQRIAYLRRVGEIMDEEAAMQHIVTFRPKADVRALTHARDAAHAWLRLVMGRLLTRFG